MSNNIEGEIHGIQTVRPFRDESLTDHFGLHGFWRPIVGATKPQHLTDAVAAVDLQLSEEEIRRLEAPYIPQLPDRFLFRSVTWFFTTPISWSTNSRWSP